MSDPLRKDGSKLRDWRGIPCALSALSPNREQVSTGSLRTERPSGRGLRTRQVDGEATFAWLAMIPHRADPCGSPSRTKTLVLFGKRLGSGFDCGSLVPSDEDTTVYDQNLSRDVARSVRCEKDCNIGDVFRLARSA